MNRPMLAVAAAAALAAILLAWSLSPDTGPPTLAPPAPEIRMAASSVRDEPVTPRPASDPPMPGRVPITRQPEPMAPIDPDQVFVSDLKGLATAAVSRRAEFAACWDEYRERVGDLPYEGRLTVKVTVNPVGDRGVAETEVVNGPDDDGFHECMAGVMRETRFESPGEAPFSMMWPVPIPKSELMGEAVREGEE